MAKPKKCGETNPFFTSDPEGEVPLRCGLPHGHKGLHQDEREVEDDEKVSPDAK